MAQETDAALLAEGDLVADYLEELLDIADLDGDIENSVQDGRAFVAIDTDSDKLVGKDGEVLDALQELARLVVMTETGHRSRLMVDVAGYRARRRAELVVMDRQALAKHLKRAVRVEMDQILDLWDYAELVEAPQETWTAMLNLSMPALMSVVPGAR